MTLDSAWRQWKRATIDHKTLKEREDADPHRDGAIRDTKQAMANEEQARAIWLQNLLAHFERRRIDAVEAGHDMSTDKALKGLGVPCVDCKKVTKDTDRIHKLVRQPANLFPVYATCGGPCIDPTTHEMPSW